MNKLIFIFLIIILIYKFNNRQKLKKNGQNLLTNKNIKIKLQKGGILKSFFKEDFINYYKNNNIIYNIKDRYLIKNNKKLYIDNIAKLNLTNSYLLDDKIVAKQILLNNNIPVSKFIRFKFINLKLLNKLFKTYKIHYPIVLKPVRGTQGNGVITDIDNINELTNILNKKINKNDSYIIEEQIEGLNYRFYLIDNKLIDVVCRVAPNITGNGVDTLEELINNENKNRAFNNKIIPNYFYLNKINIYNNTILEKNKNIILNNVVNYHRGATIKHIPIENIHIDNINIMLNINNIFKTNICGVDIISNNINESYKNNKYTFNIIELNSSPHDEIHWFDPTLDKNFKNKFIKKCLDTYFANPKLFKY